MTIQQKQSMLDMGEVWEDFLNFKENFNAKPKRVRIKSVSPIFSYKRYNQLKQELNKN